MTTISQNQSTNFDFGNFSDACNVFVPRASNAQQNSYGTHNHRQLNDFSHMQELPTPNAF